MKVAAFVGAAVLSLPAIADEGFPRLDVHGLIDLQAVQTDDQPGWLGQDPLRQQTERHHVPDELSLHVLTPAI
ncbi:MAG: hypothetical protein GKS00_23805 [Alphaproteobacteria bacterium]|nr:hypothetical protein [Alphaproteobacteria bacterium]